MKVNGIDVAGVTLDQNVTYDVIERDGGVFVKGVPGVTSMTIPGWGPLPLPPPSSSAFSFSDSLRGNLADEGRWDELRTEPAGKAAVVARDYGTLFRAPGNTGKALVSKYLPSPLGEGYRHGIKASVIFPSTAIPKQCFLFDLEASRAAGGGESEAGIRVKVNDSGLLEIAGDKIGSTMWRPVSGAPKLALGGLVNVIDIDIDAALDPALGAVQAFVNGTLAVRGFGRTLPEIGYKGVTASVIDRLQAGLTANGGTATQEVVMSDLLWTVTRVA